MNYGPLVFLAALFALASSWVSFVLAPQLQLGQLQQTNSVGSATIYPVARPGLAQEGLQVYRANGCATCHSQQVGQTGAVCDVLVTETGTNQPALLSALSQVKPGLSEAEARRLLEQLPATILRGLNKESVEAVVKTLNASSAKAQVWVVATGPDVARGWGKRRSVAEDFLFDSPVMPGAQRIGPDLANVGTRLPDPAWHLIHLYAPRSKVPGSLMPPYRFLFEIRKVRQEPSPEALVLPKEFAPQTGYEVVPTTEARALVAYMLSLQSDVPLFPAPFSLAALPKPADTNAPAATIGGGTNTVPTNAPGK